MSMIHLKKADSSKYRIFVAEDGSWGDADGLEILEITAEQLQKLNDLLEHQQLDYLGDIPNTQSILTLDD